MTDNALDTKYARLKAEDGTAVHAATPTTVTPEMMREARRGSVCRYCGRSIRLVDGKWCAEKSRWTNHFHCHYSAINRKSVGHVAEDGARD